MWVRVEGTGISLAINVDDEIDALIVKLAIELAIKRKPASLEQLLQGE